MSDDTDRLPDALLNRLHDLVEDGDRLARTLVTERPPAIRVNTLKAEAEPTLRRLRDVGVEVAPISWTPDGYWVEDGDPGRTLPHFLGHVYVQSPTSMLPPLAVAETLEDAPRVLDACAAPGSKATQIAALMGNRGTLIANDRDDGRIAALKGNMGRCGVTNAAITERDVRQVDWDGGYDVVFADVPCSGEGILRKSWGPLEHWSEHHIRSIAGIQKEILAKALDLVRDDGLVVYSTCTLAPEENEAVISDVVAKRGGSLRTVAFDGLETRPGRVAWRGESYDEMVADAVRVYPHDNDTDGFFLAVIEP